MTLPSGETVAYTYDSSGNRLTKTVTTGGPRPTTTQIKDVWQGGRIAYETDGANNILATFAYDSSGTPTSVQVGSDPSSAPRYYYVYNWHGDVIALVDSSGNAVASYSYDAFGAVQTDTDNFGNGWHNPYLYDGKDRYYYDAETALYWLSVRAYDPTLGRFIARDPLGRAPAMGLATQPYVYGDNSPLKNIDPSGQVIVFDTGEKLWFVPIAPGTRMQSGRGINLTGPTASCQDSSVYYPQCSKYYQWEAQANAARWNHVTSERMLGAGIMAAFVGAAVILEFLLVANTKDVLQAILGLQSLLQMLVLGVDAFKIFTARSYQDYSGGNSLEGGLLAGINGIMALILGMAAAVGAAPKWLRNAFGWMIRAGEAAAEGPAAAIMAILESLAQNAGASAINAGISTLIGSAWLIKAKIDDDLGSAIWDWCARPENAGVCPSAPSSTVTL